MGGPSRPKVSGLRWPASGLEEAAPRRAHCASVAVLTAQTCMSADGATHDGARVAICGTPGPARWPQARRALVAKTVSRAMGRHEVVTPRLESVAAARAAPGSSLAGCSSYLKEQHDGMVPGCLSQACTIRCSTRRSSCKTTFKSRT